MEPSATATPPETETASPSPSEAAEQTVEVGAPVSFSITVPGDWEEDAAVSSATTFSFRSGVDRWLVFTELGPDTVEGWIEELTTGAAFTAGEPEAVELDGAPGFRVDIELAEGREEAVLFQEATIGTWTVSAERPTRVWVVESPGGTVLIVTDAPERAFDGWVEVVEDALATLAWGG